MELIFILILAFIVLGPNEVVNAARKMGRTISRIVRSPEWSSIMNTSKEFRDLPSKIVREAGLDGTLDEIKEDVGEIQEGLNEQIDLTDQKDTNRLVSENASQDAPNALEPEEKITESEEKV